MEWGFSCLPQVLKMIGSRITILRIFLESNIKLNLQLCFSSESVPSVLSQVGLKLRVTKFLLSLTFRDFLLLVERMSSLHGGHLTWCALGGHTGKVCWSHFLLLRRESGSCCLKGSRLLSLPFHQWPLFGSFLYAKWCFLPSADCPGHCFSSTPSYFLHSVCHPLKCSPSDICGFCWNRISTNVLSFDSCVWYGTWKRRPLVTVWTE